MKKSKAVAVSKVVKEQFSDSDLDSDNEEQNVRKKAYKLEVGEVFENLPYVRPRKRPNESFRSFKKPKVQDKCQQKRLIAASRIMNAFNSGDIEHLIDILKESSESDCEIDFPLLKKSYKGIDVLSKIFQSLFESFPDGSFLFSPTTVDWELSLLTKFNFFGTKILPVHLPSTAVQPVADDADLTNDMEVYHKKYPSLSKYANTTKAPLTNNDDIDLAMSKQTDLSGIAQIVSAFYSTDENNALNVIADAVDVATTRLSLSIQSVSSNSTDSSLSHFSRISSGSISNLSDQLPAASSLVDARTSKSAATVEPEEFQTNGCMILKLNSSDYLIKRFIFTWDRNCAE